ncbi:hypothetical protein E2C01_022858 [Portunus trituberculatus]|uniref:Uncharacterized protein n=1 Tax=Portunus trituberculatus TaxID=210409 RepID=A0A5B7E8E7_PORTR|nr:hypothetical protein [Portunus trituberculatus]
MTELLGLMKELTAELKLTDALYVVLSLLVFCGDTGADLGAPPCPGAERSAPPTGYGQAPQPSVPLPRLRFIKCYYWNSFASASRHVHYRLITCLLCIPATYTHSDYRQQVNTRASCTPRPGIARCTLPHVRHTCRLPGCRELRQGVVFTVEIVSPSRAPPPRPLLLRTRGIRIRQNSQDGRHRDKF